MGKVQYKGLMFDSQLEVDYCKYIERRMFTNEVKHFFYHPKNPIQITNGNKYTPDFIVVYEDRVEIIETKGYSQFSFMKDNMIHNIMLSKTETELREWLEANGLYISLPIIYRKIKYLKAYGFVDWDFKNPNTIANKRKEKITELSAELKELRQFKKDTERYFNLHNKSKLTAKQKEFIAKYLNQFYRDEE